MRFVVRTRRRLLRSRPGLFPGSDVHGRLVTVLRPPVTRRSVPSLGFVPPPPILFAVLAATVIVYLGARPGLKTSFYRRVKLA